ncbi:MAG TPA: transcription antitermination factor NusB [Desulfotomaculum sp.]|nr:transcription antitermination factor NusB [Desulfotomaculum sp.]
MSRRRAREAGVIVLFEVDIGRAEVREAFERRMNEWNITGPDREFAESLVFGVHLKQQTIDGIVAELSRDWRIERMNGVDRNVMRVALYELLFRDDIPPNVAINEAVEIAKRYAGEESPRFVNGILGKVAERLDMYKEKVN